MLNTVSRCIDKYEYNDKDFQDMYNEYVMQIQDMDIENELLPLIKNRTTEFLKFQKKLLRERNKARKKIGIDF